MKVKVVLESTGFGFNHSILDWLVSDPENLNTVEKLKNGGVCEIPANIAKGFHNLVNLETGEMVSTSFSLTIPLEELKKYKTEESSAEIKKEISKQLRVSKPKIVQKKDEENF